MNEHIQPIDQHPLDTCPKCGKEYLRMSFFHEADQTRIDAMVIHSMKIVDTPFGRHEATDEKCFISTKDAGIQNIAMKRDRMPVKRYSVFTNAEWGSGKPQSFEVKAINIEEAWESAKSSNVITANELEVENVMMHYSELKDRIPVEDAIQLQEPYQNRLVCPECVEHPQGEPSEVHDCKTVFMKNKEAVGQCLCYSKEHGLGCE